jgi:membrane associated rhomboid family serine protease
MSARKTDFSQAEPGRDGPTIGEALMRREVWRLTEGLVFMHFAVFFLTSTREGAWETLALVPQLLSSRPWTLVTYQFIHGGMFSFLISMLILFIMGKPLEEEWGSPKFLAFWLISTLGAAGAAVFLQYGLASDVFLRASLLFTYATMYPDVEWRLYFVLPVKAKYLAMIFGALLIFSSFRYGLRYGVINVVGMSAGYVFFLVTRRIPSRRKLAFELKKRKASIEVAAESEAIESVNQRWDGPVREAEKRARELGRVADQDLPLLEALDAARDQSITVCGPADFRYVEDDVCRTCKGYPECAARVVRMAAEEGESG